MTDPDQHRRFEQSIERLRRSLLTFASAAAIVHQELADLGRACGDHAYDAEREREMAEAALARAAKEQR
jgi:hypothetical protein